MTFKILNTISKSILFAALLFSYTPSKANSLADSYMNKIQKSPDLSFRQLILDKLYPLNFKKEKENNSQAESAFIENFTDNNHTAITISDTKQHEYFIANKNYALAIYSVDDGFFKYGVLFEPDGSVSKVILLGYSFGNNEFQVKRDYKMGIGKNITFLIEEKRFDKTENGKELTSKERYFITLKPDATLEIKHTDK